MLAFAGAVIALSFSARLTDPRRLRLSSSLCQPGFPRNDATHDGANRSRPLGGACPRLPRAAISPRSARLS